MINMGENTMIEINKRMYCPEDPSQTSTALAWIPTLAEPLIKTGLGPCVLINYLTECNSANTDDPLLMCHVGDLNHSSRAKGQAHSRTLMVKPCFLITSHTTTSSGLTNTQTHMHTPLHLIWLLNVSSFSLLKLFFVV